jgi:hypothetical protein
MGLHKQVLRYIIASFLLLSIVLHGPLPAGAQVSQLMQIDATEIHEAESSYWIWMVLPRLFPEYLSDSGGYLALGFPWLEGEETPTGIRKLPGKILGESQQRLDCMACHGSHATQTPFSADSPALRPSENQYVKAAFTHPGYAAFLRRCAEDPRFEADYLLPAIRYNHKIGWVKEWYYRLILIPQARQSFQALPV